MKKTRSVFTCSVLCTILIMVLSTCTKKSPYDPQEGQTNWQKYAFHDVDDVSKYDFFYSDMKDVKFVSENVGYMIGGIQYHEVSPAMYVTTDGGLTWTSNYVHFCGSGSHLNTIISGYNNNLYSSTVCVGYHYNSFENGVGWNPETEQSFYQFTNDIPESDFKLTNSILFMSSIRSIDGGVTWEQLDYPENTTDYYFFTTGQGVCVTSSGKIGFSDDLGESWQIIYDNPSKEFNTVTVLPSGTIIAAGNGIIKGNGSVWSEVNSAQNIYDVAFYNGQIGFAAICNYFDYQAANGEILKTVDGGQTWTKNYHSSFMGFRRLCIAAGSNNIFAVGFQRNDKIGKCFYLKTSTLGE